MNAACKVLFYSYRINVNDVYFIDIMVWCIKVLVEERLPGSNYIVWMHGMNKLDMHGIFCEHLFTRLSWWVVRIVMFFLCTTKWLSFLRCYEFIALLKFIIVGYVCSNLQDLTPILIFLLERSVSNYWTCCGDSFNGSNSDCLLVSCKDWISAKCKYLSKRS